MGFFDKLMKAAKTVSDIMDNANGNNQNRTQTTSAATTPAPAAQSPKPASRPATPKTADKKTKQHYFDFANAQPLAEKTFTGTYFDGDENGNDYQIDYSFTATEDFQEVDSGAAEIDMMLCFHGDGEDILELSYCPPSIIICDAPEKQVINPVKKCLDGESADNVMMFMKVSDIPIASCKAKVKAFGQIYYLYVVKRGLDDHMQYIGACYGVDAVGTALEQRMVDAVDTVVRTYNETLKKC